MSPCQERDPETRHEALDRAGFNTNLLTSEEVRIDLATDSLMHLDSARSRLVPPRLLSKTARDVEQAIGEFFGFPYVLPVAQGRLAEAIVANTMVHPGQTVPSSALFATTRMHQIARGASVLEILEDEAYVLMSEDPFKGNIDIEKLDAYLAVASPGQVPYVYVESCNDACGAQPLSLRNLRQVREVTNKHGVLLFMDACRIVDNALMIRDREPEHRQRSAAEIVLEMCVLCDGITMSFTKNFAVGVGGCIATRHEDLYHRFRDGVLLIGSGLSQQDTAWIAAAVTEGDAVFARVKRRQQLVKDLHLALSSSVRLVHPVGAHALYLDVTEPRSRASREQKFVQQIYLAALFCRSGVRGSIHMSEGFDRRGAKLIRLAVPICGMDINLIRQVDQSIRTHQVPDFLKNGLERVRQSDSASDAWMAQYRPYNPASDRSVINEGRDFIQQVVTT